MSFELKFNVYNKLRYIHINDIKHFIEITWRVRYTSNAKITCIGIEVGIMPKGVIYINYLV